MKSNTHKSLDGVYKFMSDAYQGNWQYRFSETPYLQKNIKAGRHESVSAHEWACIWFWFHFSRVCPSLGALVDKAEIYERLLSHDLGETFVGDISLVSQLNGKGKNKHFLEREEIKKITKNLPEKIAKEIVDWFDEFETDFSKIKKLEVLIVKFIDTIEGNHFALVFGNDMDKHAETIKKIVNKTFVPITQQLLKILQENGHKKAYNEVEFVAIHHLNTIKKVGVEIKPDFK